MITNSPHFLYTTFKLLRANGIKTWIFGGWAEELQNLIEPRPHRDIDLLYPASDFSRLETVIENIHGMTEIQANRFSHKRAVMYYDVMVEFLLLEQEREGYVTHFFAGRHVFHWPTSTLAEVTLPTGQTLAVASSEALQRYRSSYAERERAYLAHLHSANSQW